MSFLTGKRGPKAKHGIGELNPMSRESEYRKNAGEAVDLARRASTTADKSRLLQIAGNWLDLAHAQVARAARPRCKTWEHPLLRIKLGENPDFE